MVVWISGYWVLSPLSPELFQLSRSGPRALLVGLGRGCLQAFRSSRCYWERGDRMLRYVTGSGRGGDWVFCHLFAPGEMEAECRGAGFSRVSRGEGGSVLASR